MFRKFILLFFSVSVLYSCQPAGSKSDAPASLIIGKWQSVKPDIGQTYIFKAGNKIDWIFNPGSGEDTFHLDYTLIDSVTPHFLDLSGFNRGPLEGMVLFGLAEFRQNDTLAFDFELSEPGQVIRPKDFNGPDVVLYKRVK